nr:maltotransferase domain-containing protein [Antarcticibacterium flavum]
MINGQCISRHPKPGFLNTIEAWIDHFKTWQDGLQKKYEANQPIQTELLIGLK